MKLNLKMQINNLKEKKIKKISQEAILDDQKQKLQQQSNIPHLASSI